MRYARPFFRNFYILNLISGSEHDGSEPSERVRARLTFIPVPKLDPSEADGRIDYVSNLEGSLRLRDNEIAALRSQVESHRIEINDLRTRLGMPLLSPPRPDTSGLGLMSAQPSVEGWDTTSEDRKEV